MYIRSDICVLLQLYRLFCVWHFQAATSDISKQLQQRNTKTIPRHAICSFRLCPLPMGHVCFSRRNMCSSALCKSAQTSVSEGLGQHPRPRQYVKTAIPGRGRPCRWSLQQAHSGMQVAAQRREANVHRFQGRSSAADVVMGSMTCGKSHVQEEDHAVPVELA